MNYRYFIYSITGLILASGWYIQSVNPGVHWMGLLVVFLFYAVIFIVGFWAARKSKSNDSMSFLLAGRKMPLWISVFTMAATWLGGGYINGTAEQAASNGLVWVQAPWGYALSLIIGGIFFAKKMHHYRFKTMLDPLSQRFGSRATGLFFIPALLGEVFWIAAILTAIGTTFSVIVGLDVQTSIIISAAIAIIYTTIGGLWSVAFTDVIQLIFLVLGLFMVLPFVLKHTGGIGQMWVEYKSVFGPSASLLPDMKSMGNSFWSWWDFALLLILGGIPWQVYFQRVLAAKSAKVAMWLSILAGIICLLVAIPATLIGMVGAVTDWSAMKLPVPANSAIILPHVFHYLTPEIVASLGLGAIAAAVMSSIDSSMLSASSLATWNVYKPLVRPSLENEQVIKVVRRCIFIIGIGATLISLHVESVYALWYLCSDFVYCLLFPALVCALFDSKANRIGALWGFGIAAFLRFGGGDPTLGIPIVLPYPMIEDGAVQFPFRTLSMVCGLIAIVVISRLTQQRCPPRPLEVNVDENE